MAPKRDYYKILGVAPIASLDEVRKAYRQLSKKYHPDLNPHIKTIAEDKMKDLVEAYNVLNNPTKRKEYDNQPQFAVKRKYKKGSKNLDLDASSFTKPVFKKEPSILERLLSPFLNKKKDQAKDDVVDLKQADVHYTLGLTMAEQEALYEQAKSEFSLAVKLNPAFGEAYYNIGLMCYKLGQFEDARINFQKALQHNKDDQAARVMISLLQDDF